MLDPEHWGLELGINKPLLLRQESLNLGLKQKILYVSDLHLRPSNQERIENDVCHILETHHPDFLLLGGDMADHRDSLGALEQAPMAQKTVLCSHYPTSFKKAIEAGIALVVTGHLHGWQIVLWKKGEYLYPGAYLSRWNGLRFQRKNSTLLVSRGVKTSARYAGIAREK